MRATAKNSRSNPFFSFLKEKKGEPSDTPRLFEKERKIGGKKVIISQTSSKELSDLIAEDMLKVVRRTLKH